MEILYFFSTRGKEYEKLFLEGACFSTPGSRLYDLVKAEDHSHIDKSSHGLVVAVEYKLGSRIIVGYDEADNITWFQLEKYSLKRYCCQHMWTYCCYFVYDRNYGLIGTSPHTRDFPIRVDI